MAKVRIRFGVRGLDAKVFGDVTVTKDWTTVADDAVDEMLRYQYKGSPVIEVDVPQAVVDETPAPFFMTDDDDHDTEDESDGTE